MRGKRAKQLRQQTFDLLTQLYRGGQQASSGHRVRADGRAIVNTGMRQMYRQAKQTYESFRRGEGLLGTPATDPAKLARKRAARARTQVRGPKARERIARECRPL